MSVFDGFYYLADLTTPTTPNIPDITQDYQDSPDIYVVEHIDPDKKTTPPRVRLSFTHDNLPPKKKARLDKYDPLVIPDSPVLPVKQELQVARVSAIRTYPYPPLSKFFPIYHYDKYESKKYINTEKIISSIKYDPDICSICSLENYQFHILPFSFYNEPSDNPSGLYRQISNLGDKFRVCLSCINIIYTRSIRSTNKLIISTTKIVFSIKGTRLNTKYVKLEYPSIVRADIAHRERYIALEKRTMSSLLKKRNKITNKLVSISDQQFIDDLVCLHCREKKDDRTEILNTKYYVCNTCMIYITKKQVEKRGINYTLYQDKTIDMRCEIHRYNKKFTMIRVYAQKYPGVIPICYSCFKKMYESPVSII